MKNYLCLSVVAALTCACASTVSDQPAPVAEPSAPPVAQATPPQDDPAALNAAADRNVAELTQENAPSFDPLYFAFNSDQLEYESRERLINVADWLNKNTKVEVTITGHCDERGTAEYNLALGDRRARAARDHLSRLGVSAERIRVLSYGSERPALVGEGESVWAKNRRDEFQLAGVKATSAAPTSMND